MIGEETRVRMRAIATGYPDPRSGMLPCLHLAQEVEGYITPEGMAAVAEAIGAKLDEVESVVTFYSMYRRAPTGRYTLKICTSISCYLCGSDELLEHLESRPGIARGQTTADGFFALQHVECLAACGMAPVLQVNDEFVEHVTPEKADALLATLRAGGAVMPHPGEWNVLAPTEAREASTGTNGVK